ncbi:MAG: thioredoxin domain-containing protein [bacterium]|nr:thioredoxin domain-containing protein [bacterium]
MQNDSKRLFFWFVSALVVVGGFLALIFLSSPSSGGPTGTLDPVTPDEWWRGNEKSTIYLVEYSDFQCPACASREPIVEDIIQEFGEHIKFVYRHFPLRSIHANAQAAAEAAEAAGLQGKFWEMHDLIFKNQTTWEKQTGSEAATSFSGYALELGLDIDQFLDDAASNSVEKAVDEDYDSGTRAGVNSTPTFFLNGEKINPGSYEEFRTLIRQTIEAAA